MFWTPPITSQTRYILSNASYRDRREVQCDRALWQFAIARYKTSLVWLCARNLEQRESRIITSRLFLRENALSWIVRGLQNAFIAYNATALYWKYTWRRAWYERVDGCWESERACVDGRECATVHVYEPMSVCAYERELRERERARARACVCVCVCVCVST
jgi:hypothetical protein